MFTWTDEQYIGINKHLTCLDEYTDNFLASLALRFYNAMKKWILQSIISSVKQHDAKRF